MPFQSQAVANKFVEIANKEHKEVTLMKLLKLVYFAHGWYLAIKNEPLLKDQVQAWKFGPVVPSVYRAFKRHGDEPILDMCEEFDIESFLSDGSDIKTYIPRLPDDSFLNSFLKKIWDVYGSLTAFQLSAMTHQKDTPWDKVWNQEKGCERRGIAIPDSYMKDYFKQKLAV